LLRVISRSCAQVREEGCTVMKSIRTRVIVALASSAVLAGGLSVAAAAASSVASGAVPVAVGATQADVAVPNATIYDG